MKVLIKNMWVCIKNKTHIKKELFLFVLFVLASILLLVLPTIYWTSTFQESLAASVIGVFLTLGIAYFFVDRNKRKKEQKERERRRDIQKEILKQISTQFSFLLEWAALDFTKHLKQPAPNQGDFFFRIVKVRDNFKEYCNIIEKESFNLDLIDTDKFDILSFYPFIFGIDQSTKNISREMLYHPGTLDDLRSVIRIFSHFQHALGRCLTKMEMYRNGYQPKDATRKKADVSELMYVCINIIKLLRAVNDTTIELKLDDRKSESAQHSSSPRKDSMPEIKTANMNKDGLSKSFVLNKLASQLGTVFVVCLLSLYLGVWSSENLPQNDIIANGTKWYYYAILSIGFLLFWIYKRNKSSPDSKLRRLWVPCLLLAVIWFSYFISKSSVPTWILYLIAGFLSIWALFIITTLVFVFTSKKHWSEAKWRSKAIKLAMHLDKTYLMLVLAEMLSAVLTTWAAMQGIDQNGWWMPLMPYLLYIGISIVFIVWLILVRTHKES